MKPKLKHWLNVCLPGQASATAMCYGMVCHTCRFSESLTSWLVYKEQLALLSPERQVAHQERLFTAVSFPPFDKHTKSVARRGADHLQFGKLWHSGGHGLTRSTWGITESGTLEIIMLIEILTFPVIENQSLLTEKSGQMIQVLAQRESDPWKSFSYQWGSTLQCFKQR